MLERKKVGSQELLWQVVDGPQSQGKPFVSSIAKPRKSGYVRDGKERSLSILRLTSVRLKRRERVSTTRREGAIRFDFVSPRPVRSRVETDSSRREGFSISSENYRFRFDLVRDGNETGETVRRSLDPA